MLKHADSWDTRINGCSGKLGSKFHGCSSEETELSVQCGSECVALFAARSPRFRGVDTSC